MRLNNRGVALLQVLIISAVLAGISTMILRATLSRTVMARQTRKTVSAQMLIESCMTQVNAWWAAKTPETYATDLNNCNICHSIGAGKCSDNMKQWTCAVKGNDEQDYSVTATMSGSGGSCQIEYTIIDGVAKL